MKIENQRLLTIQIQLVMEKISIDVCPYCKSENFEYMGENDYWNGREYHCHKCDCWFNEDDYQHQLYWEQISCLLNDTSEEHPLELNCNIILPSVDEKSCGLSDSEKLNIDKMFQVEGEGTMWYHFEYNDEFPNGFDGERVPIWNDMYELSTEDLKAILESLQFENHK